ncbi:NAD(P)-binding domain-containing protein, partial [Streptococcus sobrinus]
MKIGFIGLGKMATAIIKGLEKTDFEILVAGRDPEKTARQAQELGVRALAQHSELVTQADLIVLAVKPQVLPSVLDKLTFHQPIMSMAAGVSLERLAELTDPSLPLIRIMPNINAQILQSTTAICRNQQVDDQLLDLAKTITNSFGSTFEIAEKDFDS